MLHLVVFVISFHLKQFLHLSFFSHNLGSFKVYKLLTLKNIPQLIRFKLHVFDRDITEEMLCFFHCILLGCTQYQYVLFLVIGSVK